MSIVVVVHTRPFIRDRVAFVRLTWAKTNTHTHELNHFLSLLILVSGDEPCECQSGFVGDRCEFHVGTIDSNCTMDCQNGGRCSLGFRNKTDAERLFDENEDVTLNFQHCVCPPGYSGPHCETKVDDSCAEKGHYCFHGGECELQPDTSEPYCDCSIATQEDTRYTGLHCEHAATSFCTLNSGVNGHPFCANGGKCIDLGEEYVVFLPVESKERTLASFVYDGVPH